MDELREFYLETVHSTRRTLATILNIVLRQEETLAMLVRSARDDVLHHNQIPEQQTRSASASATQSSAAGRRRDRSLFERSGTAPIIARTQVQRRRLFNPSVEAPAAVYPVYRSCRTSSKLIFNSWHGTWCSCCGKSPRG